MVQKTDFVSQLPPEILGEILIHCTTSNPDSPAVLSTVSHRFHQVLASTPQVWKELHLSLVDISDAACTRKALIWFRRAASCSVRVTINIGPPLASTDSTHLILPHILRSFSSRTEWLTLQASSESDAQEFVSTVFCCEAEDIPLKGLSIIVKPSDTWHPPLSLPALSPPVPTATPPLQSLTLPKLPKLEYLNLSNTSLPEPSCIDLRNLKSLTLVHPVRSSAIHLSHILRILRSTPQLLNLEIQGRITDSLDPRSNSAHKVHEEDVTEPEVDEQEDDPFAPLSLPHLTHISIRSNHIPQFLPALIMPELNTLRLEDLDGRRVHASEETAKVIRQMLVRMDLPGESRKKGSGLKVLDLSGVSIKRCKDREEGLWEWCFRRMWFLEELHVKNVNVDELLEILLPHRNQNRSTPTEYTIDDSIIPRLRSLSIVDNHVSTGVKRFQKIRPLVNVKYEITDEPNHSYLSTSSPTILSPSLSSASRRGFGFGSPFHLRRVASYDKKH